MKAEHVCDGTCDGHVALALARDDDGGESESGTEVPEESTMVPITMPGMLRMQPTRVDWTQATWNSCRTIFWSRAQRRRKKRKMTERMQKEKSHSTGNLVTGKWAVFAFLCGDGLEGWRHLDGDEERGAPQTRHLIGRRQSD